MFQPNDYVVYGRSGVCRVEGMKRLDGTDYYLLRSLHQNCRITTPVNGKNAIRAVISKDEANALIDAIPTVKAEVPATNNARELSEKYRASVMPQECRELIELTMSIYAKKKAAQKAKKRLSSTDEAFLKEGEGLLFGELAIALDIPFDEVQNYIKSRLDGGGHG